VAGVGPGGAKLSGLPPVFDADARCLILGSFPSPASLAAGQYYAHPQNQFWRLVGDSLGEPLAGLPYAERLIRVRTHGIAIWDVYRTCRRDGALDSAIREAEDNRLDGLLGQAPWLRTVLFNGKTAARFAERFADRGLAVRDLPSSSPAYTLAYGEKLRSWRAGLAAATRLQGSC
jgi:double-stranded uracil-DNA glycosylase